MVRYGKEFPTAVEVLGAHLQESLTFYRFLMPIGTAIELESESVDIDNLMRLRKQFDVSTEALFLRIVKLTNEPCAMFAAARVTNGGETPNFRVDYAAPSRTWRLDIPQGLRVSGSSALSACTAVGYTSKGFERWNSWTRIFFHCSSVTACHPMPPVYQTLEEVLK